MAIKCGTSTGIISKYILIKQEVVRKIVYIQDKLLKSKKLLFLVDFRYELC